MKTLPALFVILLLVSSPVFGDEVDDGLSKQASQEVRAHTREMIRAGVDSREALRMTRAMEQNRFQVANIIRAQEAVMGAVKDGVPPAPVMNKAYEGITKRAQDRDVVRAMERTRERYTAAYQSARKVSGSDADVQKTGNKVAEGMTAGLKSQDVDRIVARLQTRDRDRLHPLAQESFMTAREMVRYRVPSETAADAVCAALEKSYQARDMERLRMSFMKNARYGNASQLAGNYAAGIRNGALSGNMDAAGRYGKGWSSGSAGGTGSGNGAGGPGSGGPGGSGGAGGSSGGGTGGGRGGAGHGAGGR